MTMRGCIVIETGTEYVTRNIAYQPNQQRGVLYK